MAWYRTGTVTVTNNSNVITGTGTAWVDAVSIGETFLGPDSQVYEITSIVSGTSLRVSPNYKGPTAANQSYAVMPTQSYIRDLAAQAAELVNSYATVRDTAGKGKFAAGTVAAPSLRATADEDTGINMPGANVLQLVTAGIAHLSIAADGTPSGNVMTKAPISSAVQGALDAKQNIAATPIASNANLNDLTAPGNYVCGASSVSATILNKPAGLGGGAFGMAVYDAGGSSGGSVRVRQVVSSYSSGALPKIWTRTRSDNGVWTLWDQILTSSTSAERILIDAGTVAAPSLCFSADQSTGFYKPAGAIGVSYAGVSVASFLSLGIWSNRLALGSATASSNVLLAAGTSGMDPNVDVRGISVDISTGPGALTASHTYRGGWLRATGDMTAQDKGSFAVTVMGSLIEARSATTMGNAGEATELRGVHAQATDSAGKTTALNFAYGAYCYCNHTGTGSVTNSIGVIGFVQNNNVGNTISTVEGVRSAVTNSAGTVDTAHLFRGTYTGTFATKWGFRLSGDTQNQIEGWLNITNTTASTSSTTGALRVSGGVGIAGDLFVGGSLAASGPLRVGQYTLTTLPSASAFNGYEIDVTNATGGSKRCRSNGSVWQILNTSTTVS
ncbi:pyocin knob domain-containing protein [Comamonas testosteroni]|uniref:pyocin knob domain-containing protein n=1 Tax=Comamonas testosteroni TaxID=285 RepID=UPI00265ED301|nr:pyocin knob domain-containing protein [Comamonas testosteroni]WKL16545.1 pyocin knob domain-containing protein [Comamonas testosteroni]